MRIIIDGCRLVNGHPMKRRNVVDDVTKQPVRYEDGNIKTKIFYAVAVPKNGTTQWAQTPWGAQVYGQAQADWPNGEYQRPDFSWKIIDGDSTIPNKAGKAPVTQEGYPGHWVIKCETYLAGMPHCHPAGNYDAMARIQNPEEIKPGDYCRIVIDIKGNSPSKSPGIYINPEVFELTRAGQTIQLASDLNVADILGAAGASQVPPGAAVDNSVQQAAPPVTQGVPPVTQGVPPVTQAAPPVTQAAPPQTAINQIPPAAAPPVQPAHDFLNPQELFVTTTGNFTREQLTAALYTPEQINALPRA